MGLGVFDRFFLQSRAAFQTLPWPVNLPKAGLLDLLPFFHISNLLDSGTNNICD